MIARALIQRSQRNTEATENKLVPRPPFSRFASVSSVLALLGVAASSLVVSGCAHTQAKTVADMPPLDVPAPPPRNVEATGTELPPPLGLVAEPARNAPALPRQTATPPPATSTQRPELPRTDVPPPDVSRPADDASRTPQPLPPATLQTVPAQQETELEAKIRTTLSRATADLSRVDYGRLSVNARSQYDSAKRFVTQSEDAMKARNLVYAGTLADKAAELAAQLAGR